MYHKKVGCEWYVTITVGDLMNRTPVAGLSNKQLPATTEPKNTVTARVSFLTASEPSGIGYMQ